MAQHKQYFFCGIGGSGMMPLALILNSRGARVEGSDRALDQGRDAAKFDFLRACGIALYPQDGSGLKNADQILVASAAVEDTVPDVVAAKKAGARRISRAELLAQIFNAAKISIGVAGTSGKSTTTAMIGWILHHAGRDPTVMNGAVMKNFVTPDALFASAVVGDGAEFVSEVDESDGSIALFDPKIAVLNNISLDHKSMEELRDLFGEFIRKAGICVLNLDNDETAKIAKALPAPQRITYSIAGADADIIASAITPARFGVSFEVSDGIAAPGADGAKPLSIDLDMPGAHNVSNALAAIAAARACGVSLAAAGAALNEFTGVKRRLEFVGEAGGVSVFDDFGHNPDKIAATLKTMHEFPGRLVVMFQPHGFGPLRLMKDEFIDCFAENLGPHDWLVMPEPVYFGGTVERAVSSADIADGVRAKGRNAAAFGARDACGDQIAEIAQPGDRIIVMGARDDTLSEFAIELLSRFRAR